MDAIFLSPHKFIGGPGSSGILIAKKGILNLSKPHRLGGGIVEFVNRKSHIYVNNPEVAEEAGTPNIIGDIKAGLAFKVKDYLQEEINRKERKILKYCRERFMSMENI